MAGLTVKEEKFCQLFVETGNATQSYIDTYDTKTKRATCQVESSKMMAKPHIKARIDELRGDVLERHKITVDKLLEELEEARIIASTCETPQSSAMVSATMSKAKLLGLDKQIIDHTSSDGSMTPTVIERTIVDPTNKNT